MKKFIFTLFILTSSIVTACGPYTNLPAQIHIDGTSSGIAMISYPPAASQGGQSSAIVKQAKVVLKGEPGSIGATYEAMSIKYSVGDISPISRQKVSFRVDTSNFRDDKGTVLVGGGSFDLPVISTKVIDYGRTANQNISAEVTLEGSDDAFWPTSLQINVPIVFLRGATGN